MGGMLHKIYTIIEACSSKEKTQFYFKKDRANYLANLQQHTQIANSNYNKEKKTGNTKFYVFVNLERERERDATLSSLRHLLS